MKVFILNSMQAYLLKFIKIDKQKSFHFFSLKIKFDGKKT